MRHIEVPRSTDGDALAPRPARPEIAPKSRQNRAKKNQSRHPGVPPHSRPVPNAIAAPSGDHRPAPQCEDTYAASANAGGTAKLSRMRRASAAGVRPNSRLNSRLNCEALV